MWIKILFIIVTIHANTIESTKLDLSFSGLTKEQFFRDSNGSVTSQVEQAKELNLRGNLFDSFLDCSTRLDKLEVLDLSQNILQRFFFLCKNEDVLYKLNVSHNRLAFLNYTHGLSQRVSKLQILDLSFNEVQNITNQTFQHITNLHFLNISANPIFGNIESGAFRSLISLVGLNMCNISTGKFPTCLFTPLISLKCLELAFNKIEILPDLPTGLEVLDISSNELRNITNESFQHLKNLRSLNISGNPIFGNIESETFRNLISLVDLDMCNISTGKFPGGLLTPLTRLKYLRLAFNPIEELPDLPTALEVLDISGTKITELKKINGVYLAIITMNYMPHLESLDLNDVEKLINLRELSIENCPRFKNLTAKSQLRGDALLRLDRLSLKNCSIYEIPAELKSTMQRISDINLEGNPWNCDCTIHWILSLNSTKNHTDEMRCKTPEKWREKRILDIPNDEYNCNYSTKTVSLGIFMGFGCLIISIIGTVLYCVTKGHLKRYWRNHLARQDTVTYKNMIRKSNNDGEKILEQCDIDDYP